MIKLKSLLITEEKMAFQMEREGKLQFSTAETPSMTVINMFSNDGKRLGYINLTSETPDLGDKQPRPGYLFIDWIETPYENQGFGFMLYKKALQYCKKVGVRGLVSGRDHRIPQADKVWERNKTSSDQYYDYIDWREFERKK